jgi:hypothetical protein
MTVGKNLKSVKTFKSGELVPASGVYEVLHSSPHALGHREMYFEGSRFPQCGICSAAVLYRLHSPCVPIQVPIQADFAIAAC